MASLFVDFYQGLFQSSNPSQIDEVLEDTPWLVLPAMNSLLIGEFTKAKVDYALKQMLPLKAPRPDGMPSVFYQHFWNYIGDDALEVVLSVVNSVIFLPSINHKYITLIPKVKSAERVTDFRPITLCNILYKLMSKVLANRLKKLLPDVISESQSAFQADKAISDNILIVFETLHHMKLRTNGNKGSMAMKLDMSKV